MKPKLLYLITEDWFFCSHFIERAVAAQNAGFDVTVATRVTDHGDAIRGAGLRLVNIDFERRSLNLLKELRTVFEIWRVFRGERPDIVHQIALKPILYGSLAAKLAGVCAIVNAPVGMGYVFTSSDWKARALKPLTGLGLKWLLNPQGSRVVFENGDDLKAMVAAGSVRAADAVLIRGAGIDLERFKASAEPPGEVRVVLVARMLRDKGVGEFVEAARELKARGVQARFCLVGPPDEGNPASIAQARLEAWHSEGVIEWLGQRGDIPEVLAGCHVVCLPSYREGLPKSLLEALAAGRPIVATDVPGCREVVRPGANGLLVPAKNTMALADALQSLIEDPGLRKTMGEAGRRLAEREFSLGKVVAAHLDLYRKWVMPT